jgi:hypothetical protein
MSGYPPIPKIQCLDLRQIILISMLRITNNEPERHLHSFSLKNQEHALLKDTPQIRTTS